jgi:hypothetical protein
VPDGLGGAGEADGLAVQAQLARVGRERARDDLDQRRLAGPVLPSTACTEPARTVKSAPASATTPP